MTRSEFIRKWLGNREKPYTEQYRDEMLDDLDALIKTTPSLPTSVVFDSSCVGCEMFEFYKKVNGLPC